MQKSILSLPSLGIAIIFLLARNAFAGTTN